MESKSKFSPIWLIVIIPLLCLAVICIGGVGVLAYNYLRVPGVKTNVLPTSIIPTNNSNPTPVDDSNFPGGAASQEASESLKALETSIVPDNDLRLLAEKLQGKGNIPETVDAPVVEYNIGDEKEFWSTNVDTNKNSKITTALAAKTDHAYFWVEKGVTFNKTEMKKMADLFESKIYPTDRQFFGTEWTPGIDNDVHLYIIYGGNMGANLAGYFSSVDEVNPLAHQYSNAHETINLNSDNVVIGQEAYGTLAHEFQHMIHWYGDKNEESWMNEGFSVLAEFLNGFDVGGFDYLYVSQPDQQLTDWPNDPNATTPHYGESFLFLAYFLDRFGEDATKAVVSEQENGMDSIDKVLKDLNITDKQTGNLITADDVFADWVVAMFMKDGNIGDGRFTYHNYPESPVPGTTQEISNCPSTKWNQTSVTQYGVDYIEIKCNGKVNLNFEKAAEVSVYPTTAHSGNLAFWSNKGDESDMTLTRTFDFSSVNGPIKIDYWTWYDLEKDYDYLYIEASEDGKTWQILKTPSGTDDNPSGNSYGWGYNGVSNGWIEESVDLSQYAGKSVQIQFEYITDAAVNGEGLLLDDVKVDAVNYATDFESDDGGWQPAGFIRMQNKLPQTMRVSVVKVGSQTTVEPLVLDENGKGSVALDFGSGLDRVYLIVGGTTRFTRQEALYRFQLGQ
jgi:immune inhibitor A